MKKCLTCGVIFPSSSTACSSCGKEPEAQDGFVRYAPDLAHEGGGFKENYFADLAQLEEKHFWFRTRNRLIIWALKKYHPDFQSFLEIGCGTGFVLSGVAKAFPEVQLHGSEIFTQGLKFAAARQPSINLMQMDARKIPFIEEFDVIGAFDVLEHIKEDEQVLQQIHGALKAGGSVVLTVPQHEWLWSLADDYACHERRYSASDIHLKLKESGFDVVRSTSFVSILLPLMWVSRVMQKKSSCEANEVVRGEFEMASWINWILTMVSSFEMLIIRLGINFPIGGSRLVVAIKR